MLPLKRKVFRHGVIATPAKRLTPQEPGNAQ
jgi:hypothetical protein